jgi:hypothetical protein
MGRLLLRTDGKGAEAVETGWSEVKNLGESD